MAIEQRACEPIFMLHEDKPGLINARKTFVAEGDPTGHKWANKYLKSWPHFLVLCKQSWFREALELWQDELKQKQISEALTKIDEIAKGDGPAAFQAAKYLANREWETKNTRGRPSKRDVEAELKRAVKGMEAEQDDLDRIKGLTVVQGGKRG